MAKNKPSEPRTKNRIRHLIDTQWCKGCGICIHFCPEKVLEFDEQGKAKAVRPEDCIACRLCELRCPDLAIQIIMDKEDNHDHP
ncbi:MAG: 4Fe-4S binding protein [Proteobacteria bacterium]|nr:4Fe-4S binding protein [Pseudomonadota bacterium]MBU1387567.1 4Fe-4S binding protein [Pseudomonadota bacterium]MBU1544042.1 4Fe-4S binding protein [Pseudomonadota bacterium]MBU2431691.1 4Fe-4S binding protein [Pseudomonadota bacterium]MBU2479634.1 4Fe-4S binding protein [Pseudomonadota bacterium]